MAEDDSSQEKTEDPTPKRLEKAREEGQVARSRELNTSVLLMLGGGAILTMGGALTRRFESIFGQNFAFDRRAATDPAYMLQQLSASIASVIDIVLPILLLLFAAGIIGSIALGGWLFSTKALMPKASRMSPLQGLKRMFSQKSLVELLKALAKFVLVAAVAVMILLIMKPNFLALGSEAIRPSLAHATWIIAWSALGMSAATILIAMVDVPFQLLDHKRKLRMTKQQVKDEFKDSEGKPEVKSRVRQLQREMAQSRMMAAVPEADVVITNPSHFSVALRYDMASGGAPTVVAKGVDEVALKIREVANAHQVNLVEAAPLARAIYFTTDIDEQIPATLYLAVAQVLAYVFQLRNPAAKKPSQRNLREQLDIPPDMQFDADGQRTNQPPNQAE